MNELYKFQEKQKKLQKEEEGKAVFKKRMKIFLRIFLGLFLILLISKSGNYVLLDYYSSNAPAKIISINHQSFGIPMDGFVDAYTFEYQFDSPNGKVTGVDEVSGAEMEAYFERKPKLGEFITIEYARIYPIINQIVKQD